MPLVFGPNFVEGKVYRGKKKKDEDEETLALKEIQSILSNKNRQICDCEAQIHDLLENCLGCGRLTCSAEGPGKCLHCGNLVISQEQRDRLQKHIDIFRAIPVDPGSSQQAKSSKVNNQFDHFTIDKMKHLSEDDRKRLRDNLDELESMKNKRKLVLDIDIENAEVNYRSELLIDDYEEQLKLLKLSHQPTESESNLVLSELVAAEAKKKYNFIYIEPSESKKNKSKSEQKSSQQNQGETSTSKHKGKAKTNQPKKNENKNKSQTTQHKQHGQNKPSKSGDDKNKNSKKPAMEKKQ